MVSISAAGALLPIQIVGQDIADPYKQRVQAHQNGGHPQYEDTLKSLLPFIIAGTQTVDFNHLSKRWRLNRAAALPM